MAHTRRHFAKLLQAGTATIAAGFKDEACAAKSGPTGAARRLLNSRLFEPLTGSEFRLSSPANGPGQLRLLAVESTIRRGEKKLLRRHSTPDVECTTLRFAGHGAELPAGTYMLTHETAGKFQLYLSPGRPGRYLAHLVHVPEGYLDTISIPRAPASAVISRGTLPRS
jgi:hypothetical protein